MELSKKPMKKSLVATIIFVMIAFLLTFFSKTLYNMNIPVVKTATPTGGSLKRAYTCDTVIKAKKEYALFAPVSLRVKEVLVKENDYVSKNDVLIMLDTAGLENELKELELQRQQLILEKKFMKKNIYNLQMDVAERKIKTKKAEIEASTVKAPGDGTVVSLKAKSGMMIGSEEPLITIGSSGEGFETVLKVPKKTAAWFSKDDTLDIKIPSGNETVKGVVSKIVTADDGDMNVYIDIPEPTSNITAGKLAQADFLKMAGDYITLIPLSALHNEAGRDFIFKLETVGGPLGEEYHLYKSYVRVLDSDSGFAAIDTQLSPDDQVVTESDKELFGGRVKLQEGDDKDGKK